MIVDLSIIHISNFWSKKIIEMLSEYLADDDFSRIFVLNGYAGTGKTTSLAFTIGVLEMFTQAKALASSQTSMIPFVAAGLFYYVFNLIVAVVMEYTEKKLSYYQ